MNTPDTKSTDKTMKNAPESVDFHEAMPGTMDSPMMGGQPMNSSQSWGPLDKRGLLAWMLLPLAVIGGIALLSAKKRRANRPSDEAE